MDARASLSLSVGTSSLPVQALCAESLSIVFPSPNNLLYLNMLTIPGKNARKSTGPSWLKGIGLDKAGSAFLLSPHGLEAMIPNGISNRAIND
jgi:hypothetical protein